MPSDYDPERDAPPPRQFSFDGPSPPRLIKFRNIIGIATPSIIEGTGRSRPGKNIGIYSRVVTEERKVTWQYYFMASIIEVSFLGQIIVAATLTALGAADASHTAITILGSVNTVVAGVQTYLKGQGLPNRLRQYQFGLRKLREHIEDRERDFSYPDCKLNVDQEIAEITAMYQSVRQTAEDNTPDTYLPMEGAGKKLLGQKVDKESSTGTALSLNAHGEPVPDTGPSKPTPIPEATGQANGAKPAAPASEPADQANGAKKALEPDETDNSNGTPEQSAGEAGATGTTPNEVGETEETPLLRPDTKATDSKN